MLFEQRTSGHNHSRLAKTALRHFFGKPRFLTRMRSIGRESFNRSEASPRGRGSGNLTSAHRFAIFQDCARAANADTATKLCAHQAERIPQNPQQRGIVIDIHLMVRAVNNETNHKLEQTVYFFAAGMAVNPRASSKSMPCPPNSGAR